MNKPFKIWVASGEKLHHIIGVSLSRSTAESFAKRRGEWGDNGDVRECWAIACDPADPKEVFLFVWGGQDEDGPKRYRLDVDLVKQQSDLKASALAKLTLAEREVLGID